MTTTTKRTGHTPGPWAVTENTRERTIQVDTADGRGTVVQPNAISWRPDATLVAAAPELLRCLQLAAEVMHAAGVTCTETGREDCCGVHWARAIIAKAEGR